MTAEEFRRQLGAKLLERGEGGHYLYDAASLVRLWDRGTDGTINKAEFRVGVRESLGLMARVDTIDAFFRQIDKDGGGDLDLPELKVSAPVACATNSRAHLVFLNCVLCALCALTCSRMRCCC